MKKLSTPSKAPLFAALWIAMFAAGCGGGGSDTDSASAAGSSAAASASSASAAASDSSAKTVSTADAGTPADTTTNPATTADGTIEVDSVQYTVLTDEKVVNNIFADGLNNWTVGDAVLVNSSQRVGGKSLNVGWRALQTFAAGTLQPGASYTVKFRARNENATGTTTVAMKFQIPPYNEAFRTYKVTVKGTEWKDYEFQFTAPVYTKSELSVLASGSRTVVDTVSMKMRDAIPTTQAITSPSNSYVPTGYKLAFNDEFNGTSLDTSKWFTRLIYNNGTADHLHDEKQRYRENDNHQVANGVLSLIARKTGNNADGVNYESGMIRSDWTSRYGYYEARVKMPGGTGVWPAFWLNSDVSDTGRLSWPPEIDIFEFVNNGVEDKVNMIHSGVVTPDRQQSALFYSDPAFNNTYTYWRAPFNFNEGWHVVGAEWTPTTVTMYVDGVKIYTRASSWVYDDGTAGGPAHILLNLAIGGAWAGRHGIDDTAFPQALQIDWVRAYTKK